MLTIRKRKGSPYYQISGTHCGIRVRESTGTTSLQTAKAIRAQKERNIEQNIVGGKTFSDAILAYIENGGEDRFLDRINEVLGKIPLNQVNQETIDKAAKEAYKTYKRSPEGKEYKHTSSTIKRQFYDPVAAVLHYAADMDWTGYRRVKKPKISPTPPQWAEPEYFNKLWKYCDPELKALTMFLCYTGCRIQECLDLEWKNVDLKKKRAFVPKTKTKTYRMVNLSKNLVASLQSINGTGFVFSLTYDDVRRKLKQACKAAGIPYMSTHKIGSHTFATWMRREGADSRDLIDTGRWKSVQMAERYTHTNVSDASKISDAFDKLFK